MTSSPIAAIVIGRNEGARLEACLASLKGASPIIYVDSGSTDGSAEHARSVGARVIDLDTSQPFTAARARNAGLAALDRSETRLVQLVDGDCIVEPGWLATATAYLDAHPDTAIACGRRREDHPETSVYNRLCDIEWNTPPGDALACGGDILARLDALDDAGLYRDDLIAGEEPELCVRLRQLGWKIHRLDTPMTRHDARMTKLGQWWKRTRRAGHAFAEGAHLHGAPPERHWVGETRRALLWGAALPLAILIAALIHPAALLATLIYPLQVARLAARRGLTSRTAWEWAFFTVLGKFAEAQGALQFHMGRLVNRRTTLIEYR
jgi:glycosyltransferase involved in cell wall biosynthesis